MGTRSRKIGYAISIILIIVSIFLLILSMAASNNKELMIKQAAKMNVSVDTYIQNNNIVGVFVFCILFIPGVIIFLYIRHKTKRISATQREVIEELNLRYTKGEITKEQFDQKKKDIEK